MLPFDTSFPSKCRRATTLDLGLASTDGAHIIPFPLGAKDSRNDSAYWNIPDILTTLCGPHLRVGGGTADMKFSFIRDYIQNGSEVLLTYSSSRPRRHVRIDVRNVAAEDWAIESTRAPQTLNAQGRAELVDSRPIADKDHNL